MATSSILLLALSALAALAAGPASASTVLDLAVLGAPPPAGTCPGSQSYQVTFTFNFTRGNGRFTDGLAVAPTTVAAHSPAWSLWVPGGFATPGVAAVAETGDPRLLREELRAAGHLVKMYGGTDAPVAGGGRVALRVRTDRGRPMLSSAAMLAPSGDWFVGLSRMDLCDGATGEWKKGGMYGLRLYDAGVDDLKAFAFDPPMPTRPQEVIQPVRFFPVPNTTVVGMVAIKAVED